VTRFQILACALIATSSSVSAQTAPQPMSRAAFNAKVDESFKAVDTNHDGFLSGSELQSAQGRDLQKAQVQARAAMQARFNQLDTNKDGKLSFDEFAAIATVKPNSTAAQILQQLDTNHDGKVSADEFRAPRIAGFNKADLNHDGIVTPAEAQSLQKR
jgi:Ca2+-binding EF-hand superfamily protein